MNKEWSWHEAGKVQATKDVYMQALGQKSRMPQIAEELLADNESDRRLRTIFSPLILAARWGAGLKASTPTEKRIQEEQADDAAWTELLEGYQVGLRTIAGKTSDER